MSVAPSSKTRFVKRLVSLIFTVHGSLYTKCSPHVPKSKLLLDLDCCLSDTGIKSQILSKKRRLVAYLSL